MKQYILFSDEELDRLRDGWEIEQTLQDGTVIHLMSEKHYRRQKQSELTNGDWIFAYDHLNMVLAEFVSLGSLGAFWVEHVLLPMKKRYDMGERTRELYNAIVVWE